MLLVAAAASSRGEAVLPLDHELGEAADVLDGRPWLISMTRLATAVDEVPVVADEQDGAPVVRAGTARATPTESTSRWLVGSSSSEHVGVDEQQAGQGDPHAPTTRELADRAVGVARREAEPAEDALGLGLEGVAAERLEAGLDVAVLLEHALVARGEPGLEVLQAVMELGQGAAPVQGLVEDGPRGDDRLVLGEVADLEVGRAVHLTGVGQLLAHDDLQEGRLAHAVPPTSGDPAPVAEDEGDAPEQGPVAVGLAQPGDREHGRSGYERPGTALRGIRLTGAAGAPASTLRACESGGSSPRWRRC